MAFSICRTNVVASSARKPAVDHPMPNRIDPGFGARTDDLTLGGKRLQSPPHGLGMTGYAPPSLDGWPATGRDAEHRFGADGRHRAARFTFGRRGVALRVARPQPSSPAHVTRLSIASAQ